MDIFTVSIYLAICVALLIIAVVRPLFTAYSFKRNGINVPKSLWSIDLKKESKKLAGKIGFWYDLLGNITDITFGVCVLVLVTLQGFARHGLVVSNVIKTALMVLPIIGYLYNIAFDDIGLRIFDSMFKPNKKKL